MTHSLRDRLAAQIAESGPISVAQYMTACLYDPQAGYYATRPALGPEGGETPLLKRLRDETQALPMARWQVAPEQGQFLALLVKLIGARRGRRRCSVSVHRCGGIRLLPESRHGNPLHPW